MFRKPTVFVIGAGAGVEYKMPLGSQLKEKITAKLRSDDEAMIHALAPVFMTGNQHNFTEYNRLKDFIALNMPLAESIDNFLHTHSRNDRLVKIGKVAIAACILDAERSSEIAPRRPDPDNYMSSRPRGQTPTWLSRFCTMALTGILAEDASSAFDNVTIVTFNYDRCIEFYLVGHLQSYLGISETSAREIINSINIIHVYGRVGKLQWQTGAGVDIEFGGKSSHSHLLSIGNEIRTFTERLAEDDAPQRIRKAISEAELVVFTGFSFGTSNWEFLQNREVSGPKKAIVGLYETSKPNQQNILNRLKYELHPSGDVETYVSEKTSLGLLGEFSTFFD